MKPVPTSQSTPFTVLFMLFPWLPQVLEMYNEEVMCIYDNYFKCVANDCADRLEGDGTLPMSGVCIMPEGNFRTSAEGNPFKMFLITNFCIVGK